MGTAKNFILSTVKVRLDMADRLEQDAIPEVALFGSDLTWGFRQAIRLLRNEPGTRKGERNEFEHMLGSYLYDLHYAGLDIQAEDLIKAADMLGVKRRVKEGRAKDFLLGLRRELDWSPAVQTIRDERGFAFRWRFDAPTARIIMFLDREGPGYYSVQYMRHDSDIGMRSLKNEEGHYTWSAITVTNAEYQAKELVQKALHGKFYESMSPKEFFNNLPIEHEIEILRRVYIGAGFDRTAQRLLAVKFMLRNPIHKGWAPAAMLDNWIAELEPYEHRPGHENGQRLLRVLRRANRQLSGIKEGRAKDFLDYVNSQPRSYAVLYRKGLGPKRTIIVKLAKNADEAGRAVCRAFDDAWIMKVVPYDPERGIPWNEYESLSHLKEGRAKDFLASVAVYEPWLKKFYDAYAEAALWTSTDNDGSPLDELGVDSLAEETVAKMKADCRKFYLENQADIEDPYEAGHDFWLTRNHHGAGFWDRGLDEEVGARLTKASHAFGEVDLYVGDDGLIYQG